MSNNKSELMEELKNLSQGVILHHIFIIMKREKVNMSNQSVNCDSLEEKAGKLSSAAEPLTKNSLSDDYKDTTLTAYSNSLSSFE